MNIKQMSWTKSTFTIHWTFGHLANTVQRREKHIVPEIGLKSGKNCTSASRLSTIHMAKKQIKVTKQIYLNINTRLLNRFIYRMDVVCMCVCVYVCNCVRVSVCMCCASQGLNTNATWNLSSLLNCYDFRDSATKTLFFLSLYL